MRDAIVPAILALLLLGVAGLAYDAEVIGSLSKVAACLVGNIDPENLRFLSICF